MTKITCALAILAAASTAAMAKDLKQEKATVPTVAATQMTESEMDKVTAGVYIDNKHIFLSLNPNGQSTAGILIVTPAGINRCIGPGCP